LLLCVGVVVSLAASWLLVSRLERFGERAGFSEAWLGLVAGLAADAPEITSAVTALSRGQRGGRVVIGSDVFNLAALLGLAVVVARRPGWLCPRWCWCPTWRGRGSCPGTRWVP
jgi:Ca2+/Na+ antiporter